MPWPLFPRSLRQLVLLAFLLVLLPLLVLAYQAYQSLNHLSAQAADINRTTLSDARRSEAMAALALEMERSYRQYCVLGDETLAALYQRQHAQYRQLLERHAALLPGGSDYAQLDALLRQLVAPRCANSLPLAIADGQLAQFSRANGAMVQATRNVLFGRGQQLQQAIAGRGRYFGWQALVLFLVSVLLVALFTRMIIGPVKGVERMIRRLGEGLSLQACPPFRGPREIRTLAQRILWLSDRLAWLESQRHEFLRHLSHELKTPLASLREGTELLADGVAGPLSPDQREVVAILDDSSRRLQVLIEQLLDYNRRLADAPLESAQLDLAALLERVVTAHCLPARAKNIQTCYVLEETRCRVQPVLLERVLENLYSNAVHYGAESGTIWLRTRREGECLVIEVANSGTPIPANEHAMIFEPFFRGSHQRKGAVKGSGLGLSIARDSLRRMHGDLRLVADDEADVCFRLELPIVR
ncbi:HAMP domain-containing sensor histidine kinase [Edwardsiella ictaluri]|uniref:sensor histidine kinase n=1 Tax=Edwardsiella ictaluri TaxID=67780 RepID=UPI002414D200|nr:HAMP domain-containing sensor histidine kinase [Edwardsiella ictaluri]WFO10529.1 HAMP domain-containing histidine kinase [Edwardsiella ictaluri]BEI05026.1 HAMP domain-containing sensor histidine kinase [Edwardsiella ictaluri]